MRKFTKYPKSTNPSWADIKSQLQNERNNKVDSLLESTFAGQFLEALVVNVADRFGIRSEQSVTSDEIHFLSKCDDDFIVERDYSDYRNTLVDYALNSESEGQFISKVRGWYEGILYGSQTIDCAAGEGVSDDAFVSYLFPEFTREDAEEAHYYGLQIDDEYDGNTQVSGAFKDIKAFASEYLGYELVDEYLHVFGATKLTAASSNSIYEIEYYLNRAAAERRPTTWNDVENDYVEDTFEADSDYDALIKAICIAEDDDDPEYYSEQYPTELSAINHLEYQDWGDGSTVIVKLSKNGKPIYDSGSSKDDLLGECEDDYDDEDHYDDYDGEDSLAAFRVYPVYKNSGGIGSIAEFEDYDECLEYVSEYILTEDYLNNSDIVGVDIRVCPVTPSDPKVKEYFEYELGAEYYEVIYSVNK